MSGPADSSWCVSLSGQPRVWDATRLKQAMECPRKFYYGTVLGLRDGGSVHTEFGSLYHGAVEELDTRLLRGEDREAATLAVFRRLLEETWTEEGPWGGWIGEAPGPCPKAHKGRCKCERPTEVRYLPNDERKNRLTLLRAFLTYADSEGPDLYAFPDGTPAVEVQVRVPLPLQSPDGTPYELLANIDSLVVWEGELTIRERKTTSRSLTARYWDQFNPNPQIDTYDLIFHLVYADEDQGAPSIMIEAMEIKSDGSCRLVRQPLRIPASRREEWFNEIQAVVYEMEQRARGVAVGQDPDRCYPRNTTACTSGHPCPFLSVCREGPGAARQSALHGGQFEVNRWDPIAAKSEGESNG